MEYKAVKTGGKTYVECDNASTPLKTESDALDLVALCFENDTNLLMLHSRALSEDFFRLGTKVAGLMLQKFANYAIRAAIVVPKTDYGIRFKEMVFEVNKGHQFYICETEDEARQWLLQ